MTNSAPRFDWIAWYAAIPGIPAGWPAPVTPEDGGDDTFDPDDWPQLKAA